MPSIPPWLSRIVALLPKGITLAGAIYISLAVHSVVLAIHFELPRTLMRASDQALEVILVNKKSARKPRDAQARAQANLDGGGNTEEKRIAKTPLPASKQTHEGSELMAAQRRVAEMEAQQRQLLTMAKSMTNVRTAEHKTDAPPAPKQPTGSDLASRALAMARLQGQIDQQTEEYNQRPIKHFFSPRTSAVSYAQYVEDWRQKVERIGNLNYPAAARGRVYGTLAMTVEIKSDGSLLSMTLNRKSGEPVLDAAALRIIELAGRQGFAAFPPEMKRESDILVISRIWKFTSNDQLETSK